jgi:hypothetical protein
MTHILEDSSYSKEQVQHLLATLGPTQGIEAGREVYVELVFERFHHAQNRVKWGRLLKKWLPIFDPT